MKKKKDSLEGFDFRLGLILLKKEKEKKEKINILLFVVEKKNIRKKGKERMCNGR